MFFYVSGFSQYAAALSSASTGVFPHMSSAFSLFPPPSAMFPTSSALPFGGLGSLGDGLLSTAAPGLDTAAGKSLSAQLSHISLSLSPEGKITCSTVWGVWVY